MLAGAILSLFSAFSFSVNAILVRRGIASAGATASQGAFITVLLGVPFGLLAVAITGQLFNFDEISMNGYLMLALAGIVHFAFGRYCNYRAIGAVGAARAGPIQAVTVPYSVGMAVLLLDEKLTPLMLLAITLILLAPAVMIERTTMSFGSKGSSETGEIELRQLEGYSFALLAAVAYGTSPLLIRAVVEDSTRTAAIGTFAAYFGASALLVATLAIPSRRELMGTINLRYMRLFGGAGLAVFLAQLLRFFALSIADVVVVNPLQRLVNVFTLLLSYAVNRSIEKINFRVVLSVIISLLGSGLLILAAINS
ncbi:MAG: EamA family transporter [Dehalococcoidia bacterium]|jgi:drug/metabolite transporter (DMT)-like permease|nr:EamA family transporter [Dehalococcoidia bacterium]